MLVGELACSLMQSLVANTNELETIVLRLMKKNV